ncbi:ImpB/MucB/SamB family protein [Bacteriovorax sp. BSW11_IV]|uniref:Y-family DNA polymerase n=1 Tax=Bacteriovorax sp. BSW11_IV TaxID=1353529 RepID=UPI00038A0EB8|nr:Y-family DNA polymerase [Bacteriovorax sp. BSW11_IV]EQC49384.1 ImpB/MucB/SamB family protein [Bacteriovorax sp. BSW11_IV]
MIALVDCNSFYCSCERLFRPDLKKRAVVVLSNNDGCVISRTDEAKALGIKMGHPFFEIRDFCIKNDVSVFSSNFPLYTNISDRVMNTLKGFARDIEVYSVDEAFLSLHGLALDKLYDEGVRIRTSVGKNVGIPVGVGIAKTKVLSKVANHMAKKQKALNGVCVLIEKEKIDEALKLFPIEDVWGVGRQNAIKMKVLGIRTAYDLANFRNDKILQKYFTKVGLAIKNELLGVNCFDFGENSKKKQEIMCSRTFASSIWDKRVLKEAIANYATTACERMRAQKSLCKKIEIFFRTSPYHSGEDHYVFEFEKLECFSRDTFYIIEKCFEMVERSFRKGVAYKKAGVRLGNFCDEDSLQFDLFTDLNQFKKRDLLMDVIDGVNWRQGEMSVKSLACGTDAESFRMNRDYKSSNFVCSWKEIPKVRL